jgi:hypothetical protein
MRIKTTRLNVLLFVIGLVASGPSLAGYFDSDCHALKLQDASGVPQSKKRSYSFAGTCNLNYVYSSGPSVLRTVPATAHGEWDQDKKEFKETLNLLVGLHLPGVQDGNTHINGWDVTTGLVESSFKCDNDPMVAKAACGEFFHNNESGFKPFSNPALKQHRPMLKGKTTLAEATALSKKNAAPVADATWPTTKPVADATWPTTKPAVKFGAGTAPTVAAAPHNEPTLPPGAVRKSGGFVPGSGANVQSVQPTPGATLALTTPPTARTLQSAPVEIVALGSKIDPSCQAPQPAAWVSVTLRNGRSDPTNQGTLYFKEVGGANLSGFKQLPPIAPGQTTPPVSTPLTTTVPYSKLAGSHQIAVYLNPRIENGAIDVTKSASPRMLTVTFPPGHCVVQRQAMPAAGGSASAKLPAVQTSPGPPDKPLGAPASR